MLTRGITARACRTPSKNGLGFCECIQVFKGLKLHEVLLCGWQRDLVCAPEAFKIMTFEFARSGPAFRGAEYDHWPTRPGHDSVCAGGLLVPANFMDTVFHRSGHCLMHAVDVRALNEIGRPAIAAEQIFQFFMRDAGQ